MEKNLFNNNAKQIDAFIEKHKQENEWTDSEGIMCQAMALIVRTKIQIVSTVDYSQQEDPFTSLESIPGNENLPPLTVGFIQNVHHQSLKPVEHIIENVDSEFNPNFNGTITTECNNNKKL